MTTPQPFFEIRELIVAPTENSLTDVVKIISWCYTLEEGEHRVSVKGSTEVPPPSSESFIEFNSLTKEQVIGWVREKVGEEKLAEYNVALSEKMENLKHPKLVSKLPNWSS